MGTLQSDFTMGCAASVSTEDVWYEELTAAADEKTKSQLDSDKLFKAYDANGDGTLSKEELKNLVVDMMSATLRVLKDKIAEMKANMDKLPADQKMAAGMMMGALEAAPKQMEAQMEKLKDPAEAEQAFNKIDTDKDGKVTKAEFEKF